MTMRPRKVFGRVRCNPDGSKPVVFELTRAGLKVRTLRSRRPPRILSFHQLLDLSQDQLQLIK